MIGGVLIVDKPPGITSHDVVDQVRRALGARKVGHLGTLDPDATGVLPIVVGPSTRLARYFPSSPKEYQGTIRLGWETTTGDAAGAPLDERPVRVRADQVLRAMASLSGTVVQVPPRFSAKKKDGIASYKLARRGSAKDPDPVPVVIEEFRMVALDLPDVAFRVVCSTGTYIRSLARDLGRCLGTGAHLASLCRTRAGVFSIEDAIRPEHVTPGGLRPPGMFLTAFPSLVVGSDDEERVRHGQALPCTDDAPTLCIFNKKRELIGMGFAEKGWAHPKVVLL